MITPISSPDQQPTGSQSHYELMNAMQRVLNVGLYYPIGHTMADQAIGSFLKSVQKTSTQKTGRKNSTACLRFGLAEQRFFLQKKELDRKVPAVRTFHDMFSALHITSLDIRCDINADEARNFFQEIIAYHAKVKSCRDFSQMMITGLPEAIKVRQINFTSGASASPSEVSDEEDKKYKKNSSQPTIEHLLSSLMDRGIQEEMLSICRQLLQSVQQSLEERELNGSGLASVTWEDVEKLLFGLADYIQSSAQTDTEKPLEDRYNIDGLLALLTALDDPKADTQSKQAVKKAVKLLVESTKGLGPDQEDQKNKKKPAENKKSLRPQDRIDTSLEDLKKGLQSLQSLQSLQNLQGRGAVSLPLQNSRREELAVLLLALGTSHQLQTLLNIQQALFNCFRTALEEDEWIILLQGAGQLFKDLEKERLYFVFNLLLQVLRSSPHVSSLTFLRDLCRQLIDDELILFWPLFVNELLVEGGREEPEIFQELSTIAGSFPPEKICRAIPCLKKLDALAERRIAEDIFLSPPDDLHFLFRILLASSQAAYFSTKLIQGLKKHPLSWLDRAVLPCLDTRLQGDQQFIGKLFQQANPAKPNVAFKKEGAAIIVAKLRNLSFEQRREPWVAESIAALSKVHLLEGYSLLVEIAQDKQFLLLAKWPRAARLAALKVLKNY